MERFLYLSFSKYAKISFFSCVILLNVYKTHITSTETGLTMLCP
jgi:hypothetical protein